MIRNKKKSTDSGKNFPLLQNLSYLLLRPRFLLSFRCSIETPVRQIHYFVSLCCNRISHLLAHCQPIPHLAPSQNQLHVSDCHSLHLIGIFRLATHATWLFYLLGKRSLDSGVMPHDHRLSRIPRSSQRPACPAPALRHACRGKMAAVQLNLRSAKGPFARTCVPSFSRCPTVRLSQRGVKSFSRSSILFFCLISFFFLTLDGVCAARFPSNLTVVFKD